MVAQSVNIGLVMYAGLNLGRSPLPRP